MSDALGKPQTAEKQVSDRMVEKNTMSIFGKNTKKTIYICGHRNPDMDSICSALGYANLKNLIDPRNEYIAIRCSHLSDNTKRLLSILDITPPRYVSNVYPKVSDVMLATEEKNEASSSMLEFARSYRDSNPSAAPVFENGKFCGLITVDDIANWAMSALHSNDGITEIPTLKEVMHPQEQFLKTDDLFEDAKKMLQNSTTRGIAVFDGDDYAGYVTRRCFLDAPKYNVILVDHNELGQSIKGIETANVCEIIDHHRLDALKTDMPLFIDAEPLGSTCTIVYQLYLRNGIRPDNNTAKILLTGIISDTLILRSPTTTRIDIDSAEALAAIGGVEVEEFGREMFSHIEGLKSRQPEAAITADFKIYDENSVKIGIGQCEATTLDDLEQYREDYLQALEEVRRANGLDWAALMVTDVITERSVLLSTSYKAERNLPYTVLCENVFDMPGVMSRKKQLLPEMLHAVSA